MPYLAEIPSPPLAKLEYELTDDLAIQVARVWFAWRIRNVKETISRKAGGLHPALPIPLVALVLIAAMTAALSIAGDSFLTIPLVLIGAAVLLLLLFRWALYFYPPFSDWYVRWQALRGAHKLEPRTITWTFFDDRIETQSAAVQREVPWADLKLLEMLPELWVLNRKTGVPLMVPRAVLSAELQALIHRKAAEAGAAVQEIPASFDYQ